jgi:hypothetical protein
VCVSVYHIVTLSTNKPIYIRNFSVFPSPFSAFFLSTLLISFFFSAILPVSLYSIVFLPLTPFPLPPQQFDNDIGCIFSRTRNRRIHGSISINNLQGFRQYLSPIPTNVVKSHTEFNFLTNGSSELLSKVTQPRLGL